MVLICVLPQVALWGKGSLQIHLRTCQVDHDCKAIRAEYLHREPRLCKTLQNRIRIRILSFRLEYAYCLKSHCGVRGRYAQIGQNSRSYYHDA